MVAHLLVTYHDFREHEIHLLPSSQTPEALKARWEFYASCSAYKRARVVTDDGRTLHDTYRPMDHVHAVGYEFDLFS